MVNEELRKWVDGLPSCLESRSPETETEKLTFEEVAGPRVRERHREFLATEGWCPACGRAVAGYDVKIRGGDRLQVWTDEHDRLLAVDLNRRLIVWPEGEECIKREAKRERENQA